MRPGGSSARALPGGTAKASLAATAAPRPGGILRCAYGILPRRWRRADGAPPWDVLAPCAEPASARPWPSPRAGESRTSRPAGDHAGAIAAFGDGRSAETAPLIGASGGRPAFRPLASAFPSANPARLPPLGPPRLRGPPKPTRRSGPAIGPIRRRPPVTPKFRNTFTPFVKHIYPASKPGLGSALSDFRNASSGFRIALSPVPAHRMERLGRGGGRMTRGRAHG